MPAACTGSGDQVHSDPHGSGGANGGAPPDAAGAGGSNALSGDGAAVDGPLDSMGDDSPASAGGTEGAGGEGGEAGRAASAGGTYGGGAGGNLIDAGTPDLATSDSGANTGGSGGGVPGGSAGGGGAAADGGPPDVMFACGPCSISMHWVCGGAGDAGYVEIDLTPEQDGCYLSGLPGHKLLSPDGTITENGVAIGSARKFGPQVQFDYPDGSQWLYCGGNLPCTP